MTVVAVSTAAAVPLAAAAAAVPLAAAVDANHNLAALCQVQC